MRKVRDVLDIGIPRVACESEPAANGDGEIDEQPLDQEALRGLPQGLLARLRKAVTAARYDDIVELIETLRTTEPQIAEGLRQMADLFDYDGLRHLLDQGKEE
jgi:hypothetical protein